MSPRFFVSYIPNGGGRNSITPSDTNMTLPARQSTPDNRNIRFGQFGTWFFAPTERGKESGSNGVSHILFGSNPLQILEPIIRLNSVDMVCLFPRWARTDKRLKHEAMNRETFLSRLVAKPYTEISTCIKNPFQTLPYIRSSPTNNSHNLSLIRDSIRPIGNRLPSLAHAPLTCPADKRSV